jgi:uncharacterized membrane protein YfcA
MRLRSMVQSMASALINRAIENPFGAIAIVVLLFVALYAAFRQRGDNWRTVRPYKWAIVATKLAIIALLLGGGGGGRQVDAIE